MVKESKDLPRFLALGALTALSVGVSATTFRALKPAEKVPPLDGFDGKPPGGKWPFISVIVPSRNEERNLPVLLPTLLQQRYPNYEVIVVDDQSSDTTPQILADFATRESRLKVVHGAELPRDEGWLGKPYAMHQGAQQAEGEWLLFTDADTTHSPLSLSSAVAYALEHDVDLLTILPHSELGSPAERLLMPVAFQGIATFYPSGKVNDPHSKVAIANGQFLLIRRTVYDAVGGIGRVKRKIAEDLEFAKAVKGDGYRLFLADGRDLMSVRMYTNLPELWEGWSKNVVLSFGDNPLVGVGGVLGIVAALGVPPAMLRWTVRTWRRASDSRRPADRVTAVWLGALTTWAIATPLAYRRQLDKMLGLSAGWTLTYPLGVLLFGFILLNSAVRLLLGRGVVWKGRTYAARAGTGT
ncbi:MAG: glycosyltransferase [Chloroflexota bacterium]|nr:glycosyltransferase [Chloroflexota bacterium]